MKNESNYINYEFKHVKPMAKREKTTKGKYLVSTLGYQSTADKIRAMTLAGVNLALIRSENYQGDVGEDLQVEMTTRKDLDLVDAGKVLEQKRQELKHYKARLDAEQKKRLEERQAYLEASAKELEEYKAKMAKKDAKKPDLDA